MTQEDKDLLLRYLCMALPYRTAIRDAYGDTIFLDYNDVHIQNYFEGIVEGVVRPYLRPMLSMTEEEKKEFRIISNCNVYKNDFDNDDNFGYLAYIDKNTEIETIDWLLKNHFDFMGLIPKGLAIEVTKDNNPYENNM